MFCLRQASRTAARIPYALRPAAHAAIATPLCLAQRTAAPTHPRRSISRARAMSSSTIVPAPDASQNSAMSTSAAAGASATPPAPSTPPSSVLLVLGCTGVGKTALSLSLAHRFDADVLSVDSMQVYAGLPVASNQLSVEEAGGVRHHMLSVLPPTRAMQVRQFRRTAQRILDEAAARGRNMVLVGGTFYWLESLLYQTLVSMEPDDGAAAPTAEGKRDEETDEHMQDGDDTSAAATMAPEEPFQMPPDAPLTSEALASLDSASISQLSSEHLTFACSILLARMPPNAASSPSYAVATTSLLRHLSDIESTQFQQLLARMPLSDVRSVRFVSAVLDPTQMPSDGIASAAAPASSTTAAPPATAAAAAATTPFSFPSPHLFELLSFVDAPTASKLHPRDGRKLRRALTIFVEQRGAKTMSQLIRETGGMKGSAGLQRRVQAVWLDCDREKLEARLDARVDKMVARGLVEEVEAMYKALWQRQQRQARGEAAEAEEAFKYDNPLDVGCQWCAQVESSEVPTPAMPAAASVHASAASASPSAATSPAAAAAPVPSASTCTSSSSSSAAAASDYLGPTELQLDWERGVGQTLGFKEFRPYFQLKFHTPPPSADALTSSSSSSAAVPGGAGEASRAQSQQTKEPASPPNKKRKTASVTADPVAAAIAARESALAACLASCISSLQARTRSYARVQARWIKTRLWPSSVAAQPVPAQPDTAAAPAAAATPEEPALSILRLDASGAEDAAVWERDVVAPSLHVCARFLAGENVDLRPYAHLSARLPELPLAAAAAAAPSALDDGASADGAAWTKHRCDKCDVWCNGSLEWSKHLESRKHKRGGPAEKERIKQEQMAKREEVQRARQQKRAAAAQAGAAPAAAGTQ